MSSARATSRVEAAKTAARAAVAQAGGRISTGTELYDKLGSWRTPEERAEREKHRKASEAFHRKRRKEEARKRRKKWEREFERDLRTPHSPWFFARKYGYTMAPGTFTPLHEGEDDIFANMPPDYPVFRGGQILRGLLEMGALAFLLVLHVVARDAFNRARRDTLRERENARRRELRAARRKIQPRATTNPSPTREQFLDAWAHRKDSPEAIVRLGALLEDLECYVDNSLIWDAEKQNICGRRGGIKQWLFENVPELDASYANVMRYKALAKKIKQAARIVDPEPLSAEHPDVSRLIQISGPGFAWLAANVELALGRRASEETQAEDEEEGDGKGTGRGRGGGCARKMTG